MHFSPTSKLGYLSFNVERLSIGVASQVGIQLQREYLYRMYFLTDIMFDVQCQGGSHNSQLRRTRTVPPMHTDLQFPREVIPVRSTQRGAYTIMGYGSQNHNSCLSDQKTDKKIYRCEFLIKKFMICLYLTIK